MSLRSLGRELNRPRRNVAMIGSILTRSGAVTEASVQWALKAQHVSRARLGDILGSHGLAQRSDITAAAARQRGMPFVDLPTQPADATLLNSADVSTYIDRQILPWRLEGRRTIYVTSDPDEGAAALPTLQNSHDFCLLALAEPRALRTALVAATSGLLAKRAGDRRPLPYSLRQGASRWQRAGVVIFSAAIVSDMLAAPVFSLVIAIYAVAAIIGLNGLLWVSSVVAGRPDLGAPAAHADTPQIANHRPPPRVTLLIALYREAEVAPLLIEALRALNYPSELLDVKLILEADDTETGPALLAQDPPPFVEILVIPDGGPRTKPRALNFAMEFAKGDIIGVYDAEDRPHPDQLKHITAQFAAATSDVACIQARLGFYNVRENFLTRFFEIEYASWFDVMLPGLRRLGLPIPLGGTSFFIRRGALDAAGGWDSYNVTEDADLGVMLARAGLKTALSRSLTEEEASSRPTAWIKQRSRWLKGYLATWITHMAHPVDLWRDLGTWRFVGLNILLLSAVFGYLALPFMWLGTAILWVEDARAATPEAIVEAFRNLGYITAICIPALLGAAFLGLWRRKQLKLAPLALMLPLYWPLGAIAAYIAVYEVITAPSVWRKTQHGVGRIAAELRAKTTQ